MMSELMQIFCNEFGIIQVKTSPYHPQTNGACERLNGTIKTLLKAFTDQFQEAWDAALPWVLFAYREVPVKTLGLSPFELMFGRSVRGPLSLIKRAWSLDADLAEAKQSVVDFILQVREHLHEATERATQHATEERSKAKTWYDKRARKRTFQPGQKVLALLPLPGNPITSEILWSVQSGGKDWSTRLRDRDSGS